MPALTAALGQKSAEVDRLTDQFLKDVDKTAMERISAQSQRIEQLEDAVISLSATYGANIKGKFEEMGRPSLFRDTLECAVDRLGYDFSEACVDAFYTAMTATVNEAIEKAKTRLLLAGESNPSVTTTATVCGICNTEFVGEHYCAGAKSLSNLPDGDKLRCLDCGEEITDLQTHCEREDNACLIHAKKCDHMWVDGTKAGEDGIVSLCLYCNELEPQSVPDTDT